jgi:hypothetical protein
MIAQPDHTTDDGIEQPRTAVNSDEQTNGVERCRTASNAVERREVRDAC